MSPGEIINWDLLSAIEKDFELNFGHLEELAFSERSTVDEGAILRELFESMTPEAQAIFLDFITSNDKELFDFFTTYVNTALNLSFTRSMVEARTPGTAVLQQLSAQLIAIGLSAALRTALIGAASSIVAAFVSAPLPVVTVLSILVATAFSISLVMHWGEVTRNWNAIVNAFSTAFGNAGIVTATNMTSAWTQSHSTHQNWHEMEGRVRTQVRTAQRTQSALWHIEDAFTLEMVRNSNPIAIFASSVRPTVMFVYRTNRILNFHHNRDFVHRRPYDTERNPNLSMAIPSGTTVYVLFNAGTRQIFHVHFTVLRDDTVGMRFQNDLDVQLFPSFSRNEAFLGPRPTNIPYPFSRLPFGP
jgi:hypothetical protein